MSVVWKVRLAAQAELDFSEIITWTLENFGERQVHTLLFNDYWATSFYRTGITCRSRNFCIVSTYACNVVVIDGQGKSCLTT